MHGRASDGVSDREARGTGGWQRAWVLCRELPSGRRWCSCGRHAVHAPAWHRSCSRTRRHAAQAAQAESSIPAMILSLLPRTDQAPGWGPCGTGLHRWRRQLRERLLWTTDVPLSAHPLHAAIRVPNRAERALAKVALAGRAAYCSLNAAGDCAEPLGWHDYLARGQNSQG